MKVIPVTTKASGELSDRAERAVQSTSKRLELTRLKDDLVGEERGIKCKELGLSHLAEQTS